MKKLLSFDSTFANTLEPTITKLDLGSRQLQKLASEYSSPAYTYAETMHPKIGSTFILVIAMGAAEYYGDNKNGDAFPELDLKAQYKNFETIQENGEIMSGALMYKHHKNKVAKGDPWFGVVHKAFYNDRMHRVELIIEIVHSRPGAQELVDRVESGDSFAVSMGVTIPYETCSICGNKAKTMKERCVHLEKDLKKVYKDGRKVYAINGGYDYAVHPKALNFFDISYVFRPADRTGYMLKKVAAFVGSEAFDANEPISSVEAYEKRAAMLEKAATLNKLSQIVKYFEGQPVAKKDATGEIKAIANFKEKFKSMVETMPVLDDHHICGLSKHSMKDVLTTLSKHGIILTTPEFMRLVVFKKTGVLLDKEQMNQVAVDQAKIFEEMSDSPEILDVVSKELDMFKEGSEKEDVLAAISDVYISRSCLPEVMSKRASVSIDRSVLELYNKSYPWGDGKGMDTYETVIDPETGIKSQFSMASLEDGQAERNVKDAISLLGGLSVLGGAYAYLKSVNSAWAPVAGLAALALGARSAFDLANRSPEEGYLVSDKGTLVPTETHLIAKQASLFDKLDIKEISEAADTTPTGRIADYFKSKGPSARMAATVLPAAAAIIGSKYYQGRLSSGTAGTYRTELEKHMDNGSRMIYTHPYLTAGAGMATGHVGLNLLSSLRKAIIKK